MENIIRIADDFAKQYKLALPLRLDTMRHLCDALGYKLLTYAEGAPILEKLSFDDYMHCPAFCTRVMDCNVVFYDDTCSVGTRLFSLAHEIGHIVLRHIATGALGYDASDTAQEREADAFAYALLAPLDALRAARPHRQTDPADDAPGPRACGACARRIAGRAAGDAAGKAGSPASDFLYKHRRCACARHRVCVSSDVFSNPHIHARHSAVADIRHHRSHTSAGTGTRRIDTCCRSHLHPRARAGRNRLYHKLRQAVS
mgnify:CR=1 FL=1